MTEGEEDFSNYPESIGQRQDNPSKWTPREALIAMLRAIDKGTIEPNMLIILWACERESTIQTNYSIVSPSFLKTMGLLDVGRTDIMEAANK